jgi:hypothetical protein
MQPDNESIFKMMVEMKEQLVNISNALLTTTSIKKIDADRIKKGMKELDKKFKSKYPKH